MARSVMMQRGAALVATTAVAVAVALAFGRILTGQAATVELLGVGVASGLIAWATERRGMLVATAASALGLVLVITWLVAFPTTWFALPTADTFRAIGELATAVGGQAQLYTSPAPPTPSLILASAVAVWMAVFSCYALAFRAQSPLVALVPPLALIVFADVVLDGSIRPQFGLAFLLAALAVLLVDSMRRIGAWGPLWTPTRSGPRSLPRIGPNARHVAVTAVVIAAAAPVLMPGFGTRPAIDLSSWGSGGGRGIHISTLVSIGAVLNDPDAASQELFRVRTTDPSYLRIRSLDTFDGSMWRAAEPSEPIDIGPSGRIPLEARSPGPTSTATVTITTDDLLDDYLFAPAGATTIAIDEPVRWDRFSSSLQVSSPPVEGLEYRVDAVMTDPATDVLRSASISDRPDELALPPGLVEPEVAEKAAAWTDGVGSPYGKALAIIKHLSSFAYDPKVDYGTDPSAWSAFLHDKQGFCQQFAGTMALMLRELRIPARVVVGFTTGREVTPETYAVTGGNLHAWVEVPFEGYGWLRFDPTPTGQNDPSIHYQVQRDSALPGCRDCNLGESPHRSVGPDTGLQTVGTERDGAVGPMRVPRRHASTYWFLLGLTLLIVAAVAVPTIRHARRTHRLRRADDTRTLILVTYDVFGERAAELGWPRSVDETPDEFRRRLDRSSSFDDDDAARLDRLTSTVVQAAYSARTPSVDAAEGAGEDADALLEAMHDMTSIRKRLVGRYLPSRSNAR